MSKQLVSVVVLVEGAQSGTPYHTAALGQAVARQRANAHAAVQRASSPNAEIVVREKYVDESRYDFPIA